MDSGTIKTMQTLAAVLVDSVLQEQRPMAFIEVRTPEDSAVVVVIRGQERVQKVLPALRKLCPEDVIRDGEEVQA